jgi:hypothetical protein
LAQYGKSTVIININLFIKYILIREFFDWLWHQIGIQSWEDWYKVTKQVIISYGGQGIMKYWKYSRYKASIYRYELNRTYIHDNKALSFLYPEYEWHPWFFETMDIIWEEDPQYYRAFMDYIAKK